MGLDTPGGKQSDPSNTNKGSFAGRLCAKAGVIVQPVVSAWHVPQVRPFVPKLLKKGFLVL